MNEGPNVHKQLGVEVVDVTPERVVLQVEVGPKVHQPYGILHGGVSALLAEGAASIGGAVSVGPDEIVVGTELNCSHLRSMTQRYLDRDGDADSQGPQRPRLGDRPHRRRRAG